MAGVALTNRPVFIELFGEQTDGVRVRSHVECMAYILYAGGDTVPFHFKIPVSACVTNCLERARRVRPDHTLEGGSGGGLAELRAHR
mmetsp:Transcript_1974/g.4941  ORF Transcript_1974/g.4941 Transcript_1974/m.4941 type:complete len:87 (+) Transcript_1974:379-639(+)